MNVAFCEEISIKMLQQKVMDVAVGKEKDNQKAHDKTLDGKIAKKWSLRAKREQIIEVNM